MSNTLIQIKRSLSTATPPGGSLSIGEQAYSYSSNTLFIGTPDGLGVIAVGGKYYVDTAIAAFAQANAAYAAANAGAAVSSAFSTANLAFNHANSAHITGNAAFAQANTANITADLAFNHANAAFATANDALPKLGGTITGDLVVQGNATFSGTTTYANTQTLMIGDNIFVLNADLPATSIPSENAGITINRGNSPNVELLWNEGTDEWTILRPDGNYYTLVANSELESTNTVAIRAFSTANLGFAHANLAYAKANTANITADLAFGKANTANGTADRAFTHANGAFAKANAASAQAANADFLTSGIVASARISGSYTGITGLGTITVGTWQANTVSVAYGGTGQTTFTTNGILYGNGSDAINVTSAGTEGQVLQASSTGVPQFGMLDGGTF